MKNLDRILVAVDLNDDSLVALEYGLTLGLLLDSQVKCIYTKVDGKPDLTVAGEYVSAGSQSSQSKYQYADETDSNDLEVLDGLVAVISERLGSDDRQIETEVIIAPVLEGILTESDHWNASLIVVGLAAFSDQFNLSSITHKVIEDSEANVMLVPADCNYHYVEKIGVLTDFKFGEINMILTMLEIARANQLQITLHCMLPDDGESSLMKRQLKIYHRLFDQDIRKGILNFKLVSREQPELIRVLNEEAGFDLFVIRKENWPFSPRQESFEFSRKSKIPILVWK